MKERIPISSINIYKFIIIIIIIITIIIIIIMWLNPENKEKLSSSTNRSFLFTFHISVTRSSFFLNLC